jgi:hypothetical protein
MIVVGLDLASTAGIAIVNGVDIVAVDAVTRPRRVKDYGVYPWSYRRAAAEHASTIMQEVDGLLQDADLRADKIAVEETNIAKGSRYAQKYLEFLHFAVLAEIEWRSRVGDSRLPPDVDSVVYVSTTDWRSALGIKMSKDDRKSNAKLADAKKRWLENHPETRKIPRAALNQIKADVGVAGKVNMKHVAVDYVNARWKLGFAKKDDDKADAVCVAAAVGIPGCRICTGS